MAVKYPLTGIWRERGGVLYITVPSQNAAYIRRQLHGNVVGEPVRLEVEL